MDDLGQFLSNNWKELLGGGGVGAVLLAWALNRWLSGSSKVPVKEVIKTLQNTYREELREKGEEIQALKKAVEALTKQKGPGIREALRELKEGRPGAAEAIFEQILERKKAEGEAASKEAAAVARHIGALAYLHDTQKALSAYAEAVAFDPEDPDGWNRLGLLQKRLGDLEAAIQAFERVLALGNKVNDKVVVAAAYGNLGTVYRTRGDLEKAEEHHLKSLAIEEELDRKEGMANQYGNLGIVHAKRGELAKAEEHFLKSLAIEEELGRKEGMASDYGNLGLVYEERGELEKAEEYHLKSLAIEEELGRKEGMASDYGNLGLVYETRGELEKAEEHFLKSLALNEELDRKEGMAISYVNLGIVYAKRGKLQKACEAWAQAKRLFLELGAEDRAEKVQKLMDKAGCGREEDGGG